MKWCKNIYVSESIAGKKRKILHRMKWNKLQPGVFAVVLPLQEGGILEIYPAYVFIQKFFRKQDIRLVGLASDMKEAYSLVEEILMDCYGSKGNFDIGKYIAESRGGWT